VAINDFSAKVLRVNQVINSGSTSTSPLLVYGLGSATDASGSFTAAHFAGTGSDVWMFVSGTQKSADSAGSYGAVAFKGDVVVSGVLQVGEQSSAASTPASGKGAIYAKTDGKLYFKNDSGTETDLTLGGGEGDVVGPSSATADAVARFSGTDGKTIKNSGVTIDGSNNVSGIAALTTTGVIELGHASDTTIARGSAGVVTIEGVNVVTVSSTDTLTNKTLTSPTLTTPNIGTPSAGTLTNCTGLPVGGLTGLGSNVATFLATPTSANLAAAVTGETGTGGSLVFAGSPILTTPTIAQINSPDNANITLDADNDIVLDAGGADIILKDDGTTFGGLSNSSGQLVIKSGPSTDALTFSGANVTVEGDLTVEGNLTVEGASVVTVSSTSTLSNKTLTTPTIAQINNSASEITLDAGGDIILDADGADIILKDNNSEFGRFTNSSGQLVIKSGPSTDALTFSGANVTVEGNLTVDGGNLTTTSTGIAALFNTNATTLNIGGAANAVTLGSTGGTGIITLGRSTATNTIAIGNGATASGATQTINIGTSVAADSTGKVTVTIGPAVGSQDEGDDSRVIVRSLRYEEELYTTSVLPTAGADPAPGFQTRTVAAADYNGYRYIRYAPSTSANGALTLPDPASAEHGANRVLTILNATAGDHTLTVTGGDLQTPKIATFGNTVTSSVTLGKGEWVELQSDGSVWRVVCGGTLPF